MPVFEGTGSFVIAESGSITALQVGGVEMSSANPVWITGSVYVLNPGSSGPGSNVTTLSGSQTSLQVGGVQVSNANRLPISDGEGSLTVDFGTNSTSFTIGNGGVPLTTVATGGWTLIGYYLFNNSALIATLEVQISEDGIIWTSNVAEFRPSSNAGINPGFTISISGGASHAGHLVVPAGTAYIRINKTAYTSGSASMYFYTARSDSSLQSVIGVPDTTAPNYAVVVAARAGSASPTAVSSGDTVRPWANLNGALVTACAPHIGLNGDPFTLGHECAQYTTQQTSTALVDISGVQIVVTKIQIQAFGTAAFDLQVYFGTGAYSRGTSRAIFDGNFKPSSTSAPGFAMDGPFIGSSGDDLRVTTSAAGSVTINVWYYTV
jgi:hypothetical protein